MDKNENGSTAQFSPEELIKRLKSQLNISADEASDEKEEILKEDDEIVITEEAVELFEEEDDDSSLVEQEADTEDDEIADAEAVEDNAVGNGETVEFTVSNLFNLTNEDRDTVGEVVDFSDGLESESVTEFVSEPEEADDKDSFAEFIAGDALSVNELRLSEVVEGDDQLVFDVVEDNIADTDIDRGNVSLENPFVDDVAEEHKETEQPSEIVEESLAEEIEEEFSDAEAIEDSVDEADEAVEDSVEDSAQEALEPVNDTETVESTDYSFDSNGKLVVDGEGDKPAPDFNMLIALGIPVAEVEKIYGEKAAEQYAALAENNDMLDTLEPDEEYEYTAHSQDEEIEAHYKKEKKASFFKLGICAAIFIFALLFENLPALGVNLGGWMNQKAYPVVNIMVDLQLVLITAALCLEEIVSGVKAVLRKSANAGTMLTLAFIINFGYDIALCFTSVSKYNAKLSGASVIFMAILALAASAFKLVFENKAFSMIASGGVKCCALTKSDDDMLERADYLDKLSDAQARNAKVISFRKAKFVDGFFKNKNVNHDALIDKIVFPAALLAAVIVFVISFVVSKNFGVALSSLNVASAVLIPVSVFSVGTFSFLKACSYAEAMKASIIGENAPYSYADPSVVAFEDKDAFPSYCVILRNLKVYGKIAILDVLRVTTSVFRKVGGPLCDVLENATSEIEKGDDAEIVSAVDGGIVARFEGRNVLIGSAEFMQSNGIVPFNDVDDKDYLKIGDVSIMYVAVDGELCAKFYIQYTLDVDFEVLLRDLNRAGVCVSVRTSDPNINRRLLQSKLNLNKASLKIVFREPAEENNRPAESCDCAVISTGTPADLVHTAMLCDRVVHVFRTNNFIKALSLVLGIALLILLSVLAVNLNVASGLLILYQIFWMIPTLIVAKLFL